jgi:hypothetical protein
MNNNKTQCSMITREISLRFRINCYKIVTSMIINYFNQVKTILLIGFWTKISAWRTSEFQWMWRIIRETGLQIKRMEVHKCHKSLVNLHMVKKVTYQEITHTYLWIINWVSCKTMSLNTNTQKIVFVAYCNHWRIRGINTLRKNHIKLII